MEKYVSAICKEEYDDKRQYQCLRKYEKIVNQFDEIIQMVEARAKPPKKRRVSSSPKRSTVGSGSSSTSPQATSTISIPEIQAADSTIGVLEEMIKRHLSDLKNDPASNSNCPPN